MARAAIEDPLKNMRFRVQINGFIRAGFSSCSGLSRSTGQAKYREGGDNETVKKSATMTEYADITLKRGIIVGGSVGGEDDFVDWCESVHKLSANGTAENYRKDLTIILFNSMNRPARRWPVVNAWPTEFKAFEDLDGQGSDNLVESLTLCHEGFRRPTTSV